MKSELISSKNQLTIVEGMSATFIDSELFDLKIYFYTEGETELARRYSRDQKWTKREFLNQKATLT